VLIPQEFMHALNIYPGSKVLFKLTDKKLEIETLQGMQLPFSGKLQKEWVNFSFIPVNLMKKKWKIE